MQEHIKDICRRFAKEGYLAIAPDLFTGREMFPKLENFDEIIKIVSQVPDAQVMSDLDAAVEWAAKNQGIRAKTGSHRVLLGRPVTWLYAAHSPKVKAGTAWYGRLVGDHDSIAAEASDRYRADAQSSGSGAYTAERTREFRSTRSKTCARL